MVFNLRCFFSVCSEFLLMVRGVLFCWLKVKFIEGVIGVSFFVEGLKFLDIRISDGVICCSNFRLGFVCWFILMILVGNFGFLIYSW